MEYDSQGTSSCIPDDRNKIRVFDTLAAVQAALMIDKVRNVILYPRYHGDFDEADAEAFARALEVNTSLTTLSLEEVRIASLSGVHRVANALASHANFRRLTLYDNRLGDEGVAVVIQALSRHRYSLAQNMPYSLGNFANALQAICICGNQVGDQGAYWISQALLHNPTIVELDLSSNEIREQGAICLANALPRSNVSTLIMNGNGTRAKGAAAFARALQLTYKINVLGLCGNDIGDEGTELLCEVAKTHPGLKALLLEDNFIRDRGMFAVAEAHRANRRLGMMEVSWNCISPRAMHFLSRGLNNVIYLYLDHCEIGDAHMNILANSIARNKKIKTIFLEGNKVGMLGAKHLAKALTVNDCLEGIFLDGNRISNEGAKAFRDVLKTENMTITRLQLHDAYHDIQREIDVYLDMNGAGRQKALRAGFPLTLWPRFLSHRDIISDPDLVYLFLKERPEVFLSSDRLP